MSGKKDTCLKIKGQCEGVVCLAGFVYVVFHCKMVHSIPELLRTNSCGHLR